MRRLTIITLLALTAACTPREEAAWLAWHQLDPTAALEYLYDEGIAGRPEQWVDVTTDGDRWGDEWEGDGIYWPWDALAECESGGDWHIATGNGYYGGLQFALGSWQSVGGTGYPHEHSPAEQIYRAELLQDQQGWNAWPTCSRIVGLL